MLETKCQENARAMAQQIKASGASSASDVSYDNTSSGLTADDVQEAIDELASRGVTYSTTERKIGKWIDNSDIYEIAISLESPFELYGVGTEFPAGVQTFLNGCAVVLGCIGIGLTSHQNIYISTEYSDSKWLAYASTDWTPDVLIFTYTKVAQP